MNSSVIGHIHVCAAQLMCCHITFHILSDVTLAQILSHTIIDFTISAQGGEIIRQQTFRYSIVVNLRNGRLGGGGGGGGVNQMIHVMHGLG